jgi:hypothetical protein
MSQSTREADLDGVAITLDVDWAPDFMIDDAARVLTERGVRATWFVTHRSPAVERLADVPLFELGLHPNFLPGSTHGDSWDAVLTHCTELVPDAVSMRTHGLVQSTHLLDFVRAETAVRVDASLYLPHAAGLRPVEHWSARGCLVRIPYLWEDDLEMTRPRPVWSIGPIRAADGLKVLDFHPVHVYLNSASFAGYDALKRQGASFSDLGERGAQAHVNRTERGTRDMLVETADHLAERGGGRTISDIAATWQRLGDPA